MSVMEEMDNLLFVRHKVTLKSVNLSQIVAIRDLSL